MKLLLILATLLFSCDSNNNLEPDATPERKGTVGDVCGNDIECEDFCLTEFLDGERIQPGICTNECLSNEDCASNVCLYYRPTGESYCYKSCLDSNDCLPNHYCETELGACVPNLY